MPDDRSAVVFPSELGWICAVFEAGKLREMTFGYSSPLEAADALRIVSAHPTESAGRWRDFVRRLQRFTLRFDDDLLDIELDLRDHTRFQRRVIGGCRAIPVGTTLSYGRLAETVGHPGAARAVGQVMATNRFPLIVPCHRVVGSGGSLGGYSAPDGLSMKRRLLAAESAAAGRRLLPRRSGAPASVSGQAPRHSRFRATTPSRS